MTEETNEESQTPENPENGSKKGIQSEKAKTRNSRKAIKKANTGTKTRCDSITSKKDC